MISYVQDLFWNLQKNIPVHNESSCGKWKQLDYVEEKLEKPSRSYSELFIQHSIMCSKLPLEYRKSDPPNSNYISTSNHCILFFTLLIDMVDITKKLFILNRKIPNIRDIFIGWYGSVPVSNIYFLSWVVKQM